MISLPLWVWVSFYVLVFIMLLIDLKSFGKKGQHEVNVSEALIMTAVWIGVSLLFCAGIEFFYPGDSHEKAMEFLAGYLIEKSLSMDNLFVFLMLFSFFGIQRKYQHEVLFWGIFGALVLRSVFIFAGTAIIQRFEWILGLFGVFLIYTGIKMFGHQDDESVDPSKNIFVKLFKRFFPVTDQMHEDRFFIVEKGRRLATPLFIALLVIETTDVAFAVDSIPAVFSVSRDPFIVLTSNIFAILGLRALYFALAAVAKYFTYLKYGLGIILSFVGVKMLLEVIWGIEVPTPLSLAIIFGVLVLSMGLSVVISKRTLGIGLLLLAVPAASFSQNPHGEIHIDLPALYQQIDEAIEKAPRYIGEYEKKINEKKKTLRQTDNPEQQMMLLLELSYMYESFNGDSTQIYTEHAIKAARDGGFKNIEDICMARQAYLCTFLGSQTEAITILSHMQPDSLNREALISYYRAYMVAYGNLKENAHLPHMREKFERLYQQNLDSLLSVAPEGSETYYGYKEGRLTDEGRLDEALEISDKRLDMSQEGTHENAIVCYSRYSLYRKMGKMDLAKYWLCKSALDDIRNAVMDQMSLISLAELLDVDGDNERANKYISFTWECNRRFSPRMRSWQIAPLLSAIEQNYQEKLDRKSRILTIWTIAVSVMLLVFVIGLYLMNRQRKQLRSTKQELEQANNDLAQSNKKLEWMNKQVTKYNKQLMDIMSQQGQNTSK